MGVQFYDPDGRIAAAAMAGPRTFAPKPKTTVTAPANAYEWGLRRAAAAPTAPVKQQEEEQDNSAGGLLGRGLGMVLNNPIARAVTRPLDVLDVPRRAVWSTINEVVDQVNGGDDGGFSVQDWYDQTNPLHVITQRGDVTFGAGDVIPEVNTGLSAGWDKWINRGIGLAGDIIADPLTYVDGIGFVGEAGTIASRLGRMTRLDEGIRALEKAGTLSDDILEGAKRVASSGNWGEASPLLREAAGVSDTAGVRFRAPFTQARSAPLPGTRYLGEKAADVIGGIKGGINASDWGQRRIAQNAPVEFGNTLPGLLGGQASNETFRRQLDSIPYVNAKRAGQNTIQALAAKDLNKTIREVKEYLRQGNTIDDLIRNTEDLTAAPTPLNVLTDRMRQHAASIGVEMPEIEGIGYFPHVLSREFKDMLEAGGEDVQRFIDQSGIISKELTGDGGFLQGRKLRGTPERPLTITLDSGRSVTLTQGTVEEINAKMAELFPNLRGTALETDPRTVMERYIEATAADIGNRAAQNDAIQRGSTFFGDLSTERQAVQGVGGAEGPGLLEGPQLTPNGPQVVARGENPFAESQFYKPVRDEELSKLANEQEAAALGRQVTEQEAAAQRLRTTAAGDISNTARQVQGRLDEGVQAVDARLADDLAPINARQADINTSRADLDIADQQSAERLGRVNEDISDLSARNAPVGQEIVRNQQEIRRINESVPPAVDGLREYLKSINSRIAGYRSQFKQLTRREQAAWRTAREGDVASARAELARLQEEADGLRIWGSEAQDRLNYQVADDALSNFNNEIKAAQAELDRITGVTREVNRLGVGRPSESRIEAARRLLDDRAPNPEVEKYDIYANMLDTHKANQAAAKEAAAEAKEAARKARAAAKAKPSSPVVHRRVASGAYEAETDLGTFKIDRITNDYGGKTTTEWFVTSPGRRAPDDGYRTLSDAQAAVEQAASGITPTPAAVIAATTIPPEELVAARRYMRSSAAQKIKKARKLLDDLAAQDKVVGRRVAADPEVRAAERALANADLKTKRMPAIGQVVGGKRDKFGVLHGGISVDDAEVRRLFPEAGVNPREVPYTEYLQRLRRSYGQENTRARASRLQANVAEQEAEMAKANRGLEDLFRGDAEKTIEARNQAEYMWKTFPEEMRKQQVQEQIISIPANAQVQMEALDTINTNLRMDYKTTLFNKQRRQAERTAIEQQLATREGARTDLGSVEAALNSQAASLTEQAGKETEFLGQVQGVPGKRSIDPAADIAGGNTLAPKPKTLDNFDLQTDPATLQPMNQVLNDIQTMARFDPNMTDDVYGSIESLLMKHRQDLRNVSGADLTTRQTEQLLREANSGRLVDVVAGQLRDTWTMLPGRGDMVIDTELNRMLTNIIDVKREPGLFGQTLTAFTNFFKTYATLTPGFHIRNAMSAVFMNTVDGVPLRTQMEGLNLWRQWEKAEDPALWLSHQPKEVQDAFKATFASGAGGRFFESGVADATAIGRSSLKEGVYRNRLTTASQKAGEQVEGSVRLGMALDSVRSGSSVNSAYDRLARIHFDYAAVSAMDEKAKRLVPFWTYTSRNLPMQISEMWKKPKVYAWYNSFVRNFSVDPAEFTPEYFESVGAWNTGETVAGMPLYLQPDLPQMRVQEDLDRYMKALQGENIGQVLGDFNPMFTAPIEYVTGTDLYTGRQYKEDDWTKAEGFADTAMLPLLAALGQVKQGADGYYIQDKGMNAMRAINPILDRTVRLAPGASSSSGDMNRQMEAIARTLGVPVRTLSPQQQEATQRSQYFDQLDQQAMQRVLAGGS